jgi:2'-5' RNA ligase
VAVEVPEAVLKALERVQAELDTRGVRARWTRPTNLHLTLKFLGATPTGRVEAAAAALRSAAAAHDPFVLTAAGIGVFPNPHRPRVLWAGLAGAVGALARLQAEIDRALEAVGFPCEARGFHGHLTLGRFAEGAGGGGIAAAVADHAAARFGSFDVRELVLFKSDLQPRGPVYTALARAPLRSPA